MTASPRRAALPLLAVAAAMLALGVWGGLVRIGWGLPWRPPDLAVYHGPLLMSGVFGLLIGVERAVALGARRAFLAPALSAAGAAAILAGQGPLAPVVFALAGVAFTSVTGSIARRHRSLPAAIELVGGLLWAVGSLVWLVDGAIAPAVPLWIGFLLLTIAGERLDLTRLLQLTRGKRMALVGALAGLVAGAAISLAWSEVGRLLAGGSLVVSAGWLGRYDLARRTVRQRGLTRYIALAVLGGDAWLAIAGVLLAIGGWLNRPGVPAAATLANDAMLHAFFVGFVFSMVFGHAPIMAPALGAPFRFTGWLYLPLALLHLSLAARLSGDLAGFAELRLAGALGNAFALLAFPLTAIATILRGRRIGAHLLTRSTR